MGPRWVFETELRISDIRTLSKIDYTAEQWHYQAGHGGGVGRAAADVGGAAGVSLKNALERRRERKERGILLTFASVNIPEMFFHVEDPALRARLIEAIRQCMEGRAPESKVIRHDNNLKKLLPTKAEVDARFARQQKISKFTRNVMITVAACIACISAYFAYNTIVKRMAVDRYITMAMDNPEAIGSSSDEECEAWRQDYEIVDERRGAGADTRVVVGDAVMRKTELKEDYSPVDYADLAGEDVIFPRGMLVRRGGETGTWEPTSLSEAERYGFEFFVSYTAKPSDTNLFQEFPEPPC